MIGRSLTFAGVLFIVVTASNVEANLGQGLIDIGRGKKSDDATQVKQGAKDTLQDVTRAPAAVADATIKPVLKGIAHLNKEAGQELKKAGESVSTYAKEHTKEIVIVVAIVAAAYTACATGCDILIGVGEGAWTVGSIGAGVAAAAAIEEQEEESGADEAKSKAVTSDEQSAEERAASSLSVPQALSTRDPDSLRWDNRELITLGPITEDRDSSFADAVGDSLEDYLLDPPKTSVEVFARSLGAMVSITTTHVRVSPALWSEEYEVDARLDALLYEATEQPGLILTVRPTTAEIVGEQVAAMNQPDNGTIQAAPSPAFEISLRDTIGVKADTLGALVGLSGNEVEVRVRSGIHADLAERRKTQEEKQVNRAKDSIPEPTVPPSP